MSTFFPESEIASLADWLLAVTMLAVYTFMAVAIGVRLGRRFLTRWARTSAPPEQVLEQALEPAPEPPPHKDPWKLEVVLPLQEAAALAMQRALAGLPTRVITRADGKHAYLEDNPRPEAGEGDVTFGERLQSAPQPPGGSCHSYGLGSGITVDAREFLIYLADVEAWAVAVTERVVSTAEELARAKLEGDSLCRQQVLANRDEGQSEDAAIESYVTLVKRTALDMIEHELMLRHGKSYEAARLIGGPAQHAAVPSRLS